MTKVLIIGSSGFIGKTLLTYDWSNFEILTPNSTELDIENKLAIKKYIKDVDIVINLAGYTNTKKALVNNNHLAWRLNFIGARNIVKACKEHNKYLIHISTNAVIAKSAQDSERTENYLKKVKANQTTQYGFTKFLGESCVRKYKNAAIVRISYPFGNVNFKERDYVIKILDAIKNNKPFFKDQIINLTYLIKLYECIIILIKKRYNGVFHITSKDKTTPYNIALILKNKLKLRHKIRGVYIQGNINLSDIYSINEYMYSDLTEKKLGTKGIMVEEAINDYIHLNEMLFTAICK